MKFKENMRRREIKFRAWDAGKNEMEYFDLTSLYWRGEKTGSYDFPDGLPVMQFTGLKDSKGVEIYEDDVLTREGWGDNLIVRFGIGEMDSGVYTYPGFYLEFDSGGKIQIDRISFWKTCEVIGNIYEHPDLIKG